MPIQRSPHLSWFLLGAALLVSTVLLVAEPARADVGVTAVSRHAGVAGDEVDLTLGCGFCFPPCNGPEGRPDGICHPGKKIPPESFAISLVPIEKAPKPYPCGPRALCSPNAQAPPSRSPFTFLGLATPPEEGDGNDIPLYRLNFDIPSRKPGVYTYVIFCDSCAEGKAGTLIANPGGRPWRLRVRPATQST